jgi:hypothetical protein
MSERPIDLAKFARVTPLTVGTVVWQIMQEDHSRADQFLRELYLRGFKIVSLEEGEQ